jgi:hypothetical protein
MPAIMAAACLDLAHRTLQVHLSNTLTDIRKLHGWMPYCGVSESA